MKTVKVFIVFFVANYSLIFAQKTFESAIDLSSKITEGIYKTGEINTQDGTDDWKLRDEGCLIPCCNSYVYYIKPDRPLNLYIKSDKFSDVSSTISLYEAKDKAMYSKELEYVNTEGNECGFNDSFMAGSSNMLTMSETYSRETLKLEADKHYYVYLTNYNRLLKKGTPSEFTFEFSYDCPKGKKCIKKNIEIFNNETYTTSNGTEVSETTYLTEEKGKTITKYNITKTNLESVYYRSDAKDLFFKESETALSSDVDLEL